MTQERFDPGTPRYGSQAEDSDQASKLAQTLAGAGATGVPTLTELRNLRAESPQLGGDVRSRRGFTLEEEQKKSNWRNAFDFIGGGTRWGVVSTPWKGAPSWVRLVNPLKTIWSTFGFMQEDVAPVLWELTLMRPINPLDPTGQSLKLLDKVTGGRIAPLNKFHKDLAAQMKGTVHERKGFINKAKAIYELAEQRARPVEEGGREDLFWGEKFIGSMVADPLNLVGFGILGKIPVVGRIGLGTIRAMRVPKVAVTGKKVGPTVLGTRVTAPVPSLSIVKKDIPIRVGLGDFEDGFIKTVEIPFRWGAKLYRKIPKSRAQSSAQAGSKAAGDFHTAITEHTGKNFTNISGGEKDRFITRILDNVNFPRGSLTAAELKLRDTIFSRSELSRADISSIVDNIIFADAELKALADAPEKALRVKAILEGATVGLYQVDEAATKIIDELGGMAATTSQEAVSASIKGAIDRKFRELERLFIGSNKSAVRTKAAIAGIAFNHQAEAVRKVAPWQRSLAEIKHGGGVMAGILNGLDIAVKPANILYDKVGRPLAGAVLMFPAFSFQNAGEDMIRQLLGGTKVGKGSIDEFHNVMLGFDDIPGDLFGDAVLGADNIIRGVSSGAQETLLLTRDYGRVMKPLMDKLPSDRVRRRFENAWSWMHPKLLRDKSSIWSRQYRRHFMMDRSFQHMTDDLLEHEPELHALINQTLHNVDPKRAERLKKGILMRLHLGGNSIDKYGIDLASATWDQEDMVKVIGKYLNDDADTVFTDVTRASLEEWVRDPNRTTAQLRTFMKDLRSEAYAEYIAGPEGVRIALQLAVDSIKNISSKEEFYPAMQTIFELTDQLGVRIADIEMTTGFRAAERNVRASARTKMWNQTEQEINRVIAQIELSRPQIKEALRDAQKKYLDDLELDTTFADLLDDDLRALDSHVSALHSRIQQRFAETKGPLKYLRDDAWWRSHYDERSKGYTAYMELREAYALRRTDSQEALRKALGATKNPPKITPKHFDQTSLSLKDIAHITGGVPDSVVHGMFNAAFMTEDQFANYILRRADAAGHTGLTRQKAIAIWKKVMGSQNLKFNRGDNFAKYDRKLLSLERELKASAQIKVPDEEARTIRNFAKSIADEVDGKSGIRHVTAKGEPMILRGAAAQSVAKNKTKLRHARQQKAISLAHEDLKQTFVNYADQTVVDDAMKTVFPFWKYETARLPFLFRTSLTHPAAWQVNHPDGRYWSGTDEGYIHPTEQPWNDTWGLNPLGGTLFNSTKRMVNAEYPSSEQTGIMGKYSNVESVAERFGFYPGPHVGIFTKYIIPGFNPEREPALGEAIPDIIQSPLQIIQMMNIPGISNWVADMRNSMFHDRFSQHMIAKHLIQRGHNPADVDFDTLATLNPQKLNNEVIGEAVEEAAMTEWVSAQLGMVRWRGDAEIKYREARDNAVKTWTNLTQQELDDLRRDGISVLDVVPMPKPLKAAMFEINNADGFSAARALLEGGEQRRITDITRELHRQVDVRRTHATDEINKAWVRWQQGDTGGKLLRDVISSHRTKLAGQKEILTGRTWNPEIGDYEVIDPQATFAEAPLNHQDYLALRERLGSDVIGLRHPFDELLDDYYNIKPLDRDKDGVPEFDEFFDAQAAFLDGVVPPDMLPLFIQHTERNMTEPEKVLRELRRGDLGEYFSISRDVADSLNMGSYIDEYHRTVQSGDEDRAIQMRLHPGYKRWTREVERRKKTLRKRNSRVDYALRAFGYTTTWGNPEAESWWRADEKRFRLDRMSGSRQS